MWQTVLALLVVISSFFWFGRCSTPPAQIIQRTDTIRYQVVYTDTVVVERQSATTPRYVYVYLPDTVRRKRIEKDTLIAGIRIRPNKLDVERMTPKGEVYVERYPLESIPHIDITPTGIVAISNTRPPKKPKRLLWFAAGVVLCFAFLTVN